MKLITIVTVCYNSENTIKKTMNSLLNSKEIDYSKIEYLVIDGDSKDKTVEILKQYENLFKEKNICYKWYSEKDNGIYNAMNKGIRLSIGEYIAFLNADDFYEENTLKIILNEIKKDNNDIYYGTLKYIKNNLEISQVNYNINNINNKMINHPTCFIKRNIYIKLNGFDEKYKYSSDYDFILRAVKEKFTFKNIKELLVSFNLENNASEKTEARIETLNLRYENNLITKKEYLFYSFYYFVRKIIKRY